MDVKMIVYSPPQQNFPHLAVIFGKEGNIITAEPVGSSEEGANFLQKATEALGALQDEN